MLNANGTVHLHTYTDRCIERKKCEQKKWNQCVAWKRTIDGRQSADFDVIIKLFRIKMETLKGESPTEFYPIDMLYLRNDY